MQQISIFSPDTGEIVSRKTVLDKSEIVKNTPAGYGWILGDYDPKTHCIRKVMGKYCAVPKAEPLPQEVAYEVVRATVNQRLAATDWSQMPDAPLSKKKQTEFRKYREELRAFKDSYEPVLSPVYPTPPSKK